MSRGHILEGDAKDFRDFPAGNEKILKSFKQESDKIISELSKDDPVTTWWGSNPGEQTVRGVILSCGRLSKYLLNK